MKIGCIQGNQNFNSSNNRKNACEIRKIIPSKKVIILSSAILASAACAKPEEDKIATDNINFPVSISETNKSVKENNENKKAEEKEFKWDNIPDYEKLLWLFYSSLGILFLVNLFSNNNNKRPENSDKF